MTGLIISAALLSSSASLEAAPGREKAPAPSAALDALATCRAITDSAARLACYDQASARFTEAVSKGDVIVMDKQEVRETRRSLFGFTLPHIALFRGEDKADIDQSQIETT